MFFVLTQFVYFTSREFFWNPEVFALFAKTTLLLFKTNKTVLII